MDRERGQSGKEAGKLNAKRPHVCHFPGLMCTLGLRGEEAGKGSAAQADVPGEFALRNTLWAFPVGSAYFLF